MMAPPDPIAVLLEEHREAYVLFDALTAALDALDRDGPQGLTAALVELERTLAFLHTGLETHIRKEEQPLFVPLRAALPADDRLIEEMLAEHDQARMKRDDLRDLLDDLLSGHDDVRAERGELALALAGAERSPEGLAAVKRSARTVLRTLHVHFQNEEEIVFPLANELLSAEQMAEAGRAMVQIDLEEEATMHPATDQAPLILNIPAELTKLRATAALERDGRTATTLLKDGPLRILLVALRKGGRLLEHPTPGRVGIQVFEGDVTLRAGDAEHRLTSGDEILLTHGQRHTVDAHADSALLLHFVLPS